MLKIIGEFDMFLAEKKIYFSGIIIGGAALNIMNITARVTKDVDFIDPVLTDEIKTAAKEFIQQNPTYRLDPNQWLNNGPISIIRDLPSKWQERTIKIFQGRALTLSTLGRLDLLKTKLYAYCDRDIDFNDCLALKPTREELNSCLPWVVEGDGNPLCKQRVLSQFKILNKALENEQ